MSHPVLPRRCLLRGRRRGARITAGKDAIAASCSGRFENDRTTLVKAKSPSERLLVMTRSPGVNFAVLVNRGFIPMTCARASPPDPHRRASPGYCCITEPGGGFLPPTTGQSLVFARRGVSRPPMVSTGCAPYFIDADAASNPGGFIRWAG